MDSIFFSVIIPTYNRVSFIVKTLESVLNQSYPHYEIIVIDDGSTDTTEDVILSLNNPKIKYFKTENQERGAARNYGISKAEGDYIAFIDSDDIMYTHCIEFANEFIQKNNKPAIFHLAHEIRDMNENIIDTTIHLKNINQVLIKGNPLGCMNVFIRKDISQKNLFNENRMMAGFEDWELWLRIATQHTILPVSKVSGCMINHPNRSSNSHTDKAKLIQMVEIFMQMVLSNNDIIKWYKNKLHLFKCSCYTYIALHLAITKKHNKDTMRYLLKGLKENPWFIFEHRFAAIIKHLIF